MHIKRIVIQGFKTYKNQTVIDLISPQFNVVVGRNGSGKSNFFSAIRFVLSDAYTHMSREERQGLIHEGSGTVMSAYVEIVFDNSDRRLPISKDEVLVRRTIGLKKDDYSLDGKSATRSDIMNLLESAGFSRSNPYYIVPQGKITGLTNAKDSERFNLLKDVSGAKVFELKLKESLKEMEYSNLKRQRIDEALSSINERLSDLQLESNDLKTFQTLDRSRKILEFNLFDREISDLAVEIEKIEIKYQEQLEGSNGDLSQLEAGESEVKSLESEIKHLKSEIKLINLEKDQNVLYQNQLLDEISIKQVKLDELKRNINQSTEHTESLVGDIKHYQDLINQAKESISNLKPELKQLHETESELKQSLIQLSTKQRAIYSKQSRFLKFDTKHDRDEWLKQKISNISKDLRTKEVEFNRLKEQVASKDEQVVEVQQRFNELSELVAANDIQNETTGIQKEINSLKLSINESSDERKNLWRQEIRYKSINDSLTNDLTNANNLVNQTMDRLQSQGLKAVQEIAERLNLQGNVLGPLVDLFTVSDKYKTAVEVIAGASLFHVVVDTDETASKLMEELVRQKVGRVTFMPLNRLNTPQHVRYPDSTENQCIPLIKKIKFSDSRITPAIQYAFGRTIVCNDLVKGSDLAKSYNLTAITLDGDRVDTRGALSGGYRDMKTSRIDAIKTQTKIRQTLLENQEKLQETEQRINEINQLCTQLNSELQSKMRELDSKYSSIDPIKAELSQTKNKKTRLEQELAGLYSSLESISVMKQTLSTNLQQHQDELGSDFSQSLSETEVKTLKELNSQIEKLEDEMNKVVAKSSDVETQLVKYETEVSINYRPRLKKLIDESQNPETRVNEFEIEEVEQELQRLTSQLNELETKTESIMVEYSGLQDSKSEKELQVKRINNKQLKLTEKLEKTAKRAEANLNKKSILTSRREEVNKKIRDIGVLPEEAFDHEKYEQYGSDELLRQLSDVNNQLKQYNHINKKAIEQYEMFMTKHGDLIERRQELDVSRDSINNLIDNLKTQKDQAISKSFKMVAKSFTQIFEKLVPAGTGRLIMQKKSGDNGETIDVEEISETGIEDYVGVSISVSFNSKHDEQQRIEQLSGGQKSLCAIALILSIQNCDPAPFYLFDEIDANLDGQYRTSVAQLIETLSAKAQFICTTFRPEMLQVADKFYGVTFDNKVSLVNEITRDDATSFVEGQVHQ